MRSLGLTFALTAAAASAAAAAVLMLPLGVFVDGLGSSWGSFFSLSSASSDFFSPSALAVVLSWKENDWSSDQSTLKMSDLSSELKTQNGHLTFFKFHL